MGMPMARWACQWPKTGMAIAKLRVLRTCREHFHHPNPEVLVPHRVQADCSRAEERLELCEWEVGRKAHRLEVVVAFALSSIFRPRTQEARGELLERLEPLAIGGVADRPGEDELWARPGRPGRPPHAQDESECAQLQGVVLRDTRGEGGRGALLSGAGDWNGGTGKA